MENSKPNAIEFNTETIKENEQIECESCGFCKLSYLLFKLFLLVVKFIKFFFDSKNN